MKTIFINCKDGFYKSNILYPLICLCISLFFISTVFSQNCAIKQMQASYHHLGANGIERLTVLPSGNIIAAGVAKGFILVKLNPAGDTIFTKSYIFNGTTNSVTNFKSQLMTDGTLLYALNNNFLVNIDTNGVIVSTKQLSSAIYSDATLSDVKLLPGGDIVVLLNTTIGYPSVVARLDGKLSVVKWSKSVHFYTTYFSGMVVDGNKIIIAGSGSQRDYSFNLHTAIVALDINSGTLVNSKYYVADKAESSILKLYKCGNGYLAEGSLSNETGQNGRHTFLRFDTSLNLVAAKRIAGHTESTGDYSFCFLPQPDGSFYGVLGAIFTFSLFKISSADAVSWIAHQPAYYSFPYDLQQNNEGLYVSGSDTYNNVVLNRTESMFYVSKSDFNGHFISCNATSTDSMQLSDISFILTPNTTLLVGDVVYKIQPAAATLVNSFPVDISYGCVGLSNCNLLKLPGDITICNSQPVTVIALRNSQCHNQVNWSASPSAGIALTSNNDSTTALTFSKNGIYKLYGTLNNSCGTTLKDSLTVQVNLSSALKLGNDTVLCKGKTLVLDAGQNFQSYLWQDGSTGVKFLVTQPGNYSVTVLDLCMNTYSDAIEIKTGLPISFPAAKKDTICYKDSLHLTAPAGLQSYTWSPDYHILNPTSAEAIVYPDVDTSYLLTALNFEGCIGYDTIHVFINRPIVQLPADTILCDNATLLLQVPIADPEISYRWSDGSTKNTLVISQPGDYSVKITNKSCFAADTCSVKYLLTPHVDFGRDTVKCRGAVIHLDASFPDAVYQWQDYSTLPQYIVNLPGLYYCKVSGYCGSSSDTINIKDQVCVCDLQVPNVFSPNGDGINDKFRPQIACALSYYHMFIADRAGQIVFESTDITTVWDGTYKNKNVPLGTYYYFLRVRGTFDSVMKEKSGSVTVLR